MEYACHDTDEPRWFSISVVPLKGSQHGAVITHTDITRAKAQRSGDPAAAGRTGAGRPGDDDGHAVGSADPRIEPAARPRFWPTDRWRAGSVSGTMHDSRPNCRRSSPTSSPRAGAPAGSCDSSDACSSAEPSSHREPIGLNDVVQEVLELMRSDLVRRGIRWSRDWPRRFRGCRVTACNFSNWC